MEFIGHQNTKDRIEVAVNSANKRNTAIPHMLLTGAAGCGKTTTARWLATMGGYEFLPASPLELKTKKSIYDLLGKMNIIGYNARGDRVSKVKPTILFFDEVHQLPIVGQEVLGLAMERFILEADMPNKLIWLPYFAIIGATTDDGKLTKPFRERFKLKFIYEPYKDTDMHEIVQFHAIKNRLPITDEAIANITRRSRGIPRMMVNYLETIRDIMINEDAPVITDPLVNFAFDTIGVDDSGLTKVEIKILKSLYMAKTAIGLDNLSIMTNESPKTISQTLEPFLIRRGLIIRTGKGRTITEAGTGYLEEKGHLDKKIGNKKFIDVSYERG